MTSSDLSPFAVYRAFPGADGVTLAVGDQSVTAPPVDGHYPDVDGVLPKQGPLLAVRVKPAQLIELLKLAVTLDPEGAVTLLFYGRGKPLGLAARNESGQVFDALLMPSS